ncbi:hypothetical protein [Sphingomonas sp. PP-CE-1G-424]|uniref:hypothetical protein n=1 Tax=Sphingomonas sp. PP-CE-1G-424 TaxID=2135658 RepID=UPI001FB51938|nr:hypothetical protein [Sphingomonas sp. PP-CE-1G-424]
MRYRCRWRLFPDKRVQAISRLLARRGKVAFQFLARFVEGNPVALLGGRRARRQHGDSGWPDPRFGRQVAADRRNGESCSHGAVIPCQEAVARRLHPCRLVVRGDPDRVPRVFGANMKKAGP